MIVMSRKSIIMTAIVIGMSLGSFVPLLWGGSLLGGRSVLFSMVGGFLGIWVGVKVAKALS